jgi:hypothetical protein
MLRALEAQRSLLITNCCTFVCAAVLKDADKKAAYDSYGHAGVDGSMGGGPQGGGGDPFAEFFRQQQSSAGAGQQMNTDFFEQVRVDVSFIGFYKVCCSSIDAAGVQLAFAVASARCASAVCQL